jgi:type I restriction enzyme, S subunit
VSEFSDQCLAQYPFAQLKAPYGWLRLSLAEIGCEVTPGFASGAHTSDGFGVAHLRPMNVDRDGKINLQVVKSVAATGGVELAAGDVLFNNTNSPELIGKTAVVSVREAGSAYSNHMTRIRPPQGASSAYLAHQLHFLWMTGYMKHRCTNHVNQASLSSKTLAETVPLLMPPGAEQTRIVDKLEELLSDLDAGVAELKAAQKKLAQYRQSLLKAAVEGRLTEAWRAQHGEPEESGAQLLARILRERRARWEAKQRAKFEAQGKAPPKGWQDKYPEPAKPATTGLPELPQSWTWASFDQIVYDLRSGSAETSGRQPTDYPVLKSSAVRQGRIDFQALNYLEPVQSDRAENFLELGDLLITRLSGSVEYVGCCALVKEIPVPRVQFPDRIFRGKVSLLSESLGSFLACCFCSGYVRALLEAAAKSTAGHKRISLSDLHTLPIPVPPALEVGEIVVQLQQMLERADRGDRAVETATSQSAAQRKNILQAAFSGQLVPQDPNDEPASVLLERIRAERAAIDRTRAGARRARRPSAAA